MTDKQLLEQALENLDEYYITTPEGKELVTAIRARLEQPEQKPVAYKCGDAVVHIKPPLYTTPPAAPVQEPKQSEIFCGVDFADGVLSVSVLRRRPDEVAELLHFEQIELQPPAAPVQEPVGKVGWAANVPNTIREVHWTDGCPPVGSNLYTTPPAAQPAYTKEDVDRAFSAGLAEGEKLAIEEAAPVQESIGCKTLCELCQKRGYDFCANAAKTTPVTTPPAAPVQEPKQMNGKQPPASWNTPAAQRQWVGLDRGERDAVRASVNYTQYMTAGEYAEKVQEATEAKLKEKNG